LSEPAGKNNEGREIIGDMYPIWNIVLTRWDWGRANNIRKIILCLYRRTLSTRRRERPI